MSLPSNATCSLRSASHARGGSTTATATRRQRCAPTGSTRSRAKPVSSAGPPTGDAYLLTCCYFYDEEYLNGFQLLLQEIEASLKHRRVVALEAFAACSSPPEDRFRGYLRESNLFNREVLEGNGFRPVRRAGHVARYRLDLATLIAVPRRSSIREELERRPAAQPI